MAEEKLPKLPPRHPNTGPIQTDTMRPRPPIKPSPKQEEEIRRKEREKRAG